MCSGVDFLVADLQIFSLDLVPLSLQSLRIAPSAVFPHAMLREASRPANSWLGALPGMQTV